MAEHTRDAAPGLLAACDFSRFREIVDVGGGDGTLRAAVLRAEPELEGVAFDTADALAAAARTLDDAGVADRCRTVAGDFFAAVPEGADAYVLKQILHDWPDDAAVAILRSCSASMTPDSRALILERMLPERVTADDLHPVLVDLLMLVATGGRERTERDFRDLLEAAGLTVVSVSEALPPFEYRVIEARRSA